MSYSACSNSALLAPSGYIEGAIGYSFTPVISTAVLTNSAATLVAFPDITLPKGVWLLSGTLQIDVPGGQTIASGSYAQVEKNGVAVTQVNFFTPESYFSFCLSVVVVSDGNDTIGLNVDVTTSAGGQWELGAGSPPACLLNITRIA
jgi:hypothetical protein